MKERKEFLEGVYSAIIMRTKHCTLYIRDNPRGRERSSRKRAENGLRYL
jgi:hypothetical protein